MVAYTFNMDISQYVFERSGYPGPQKRIFRKEEKYEK